jgi:hypothetical protein
MRPIENVDRITFTVETLVVRDGRKLARLRPDEDGYYRDHPMAVLGIPSRNNTYYDVAEFVDQLTSPHAAINKLLTDGNLYGEYGHPQLVGLSHQDQLNRLAMIDDKLVSHHFRRIATGKKLENGGVLITGDVKPTGPHGRMLAENFNEPFMNTSFSLRAITQDRMENGLRRRKTRKLVTFDAVAAGGYAEASKRYAPSTESLNIVFDPVREMASFQEVALETFSDTELNEIFGAKTVALFKKKATLIKGTGLVQLDGEDKLRSLYHELIPDL